MSRLTSNAADNEGSISRSASKNGIEIGTVVVVVERERWGSQAGSGVHARAESDMC